MSIKDKIILGTAFVCGCVLTFLMGWIMFDGIPLIVAAVKQMNTSKSKWPKALLRKSLRQGPAAAFFVKSYSVSTYGKKIFLSFATWQADNTLVESSYHPNGEAIMFNYFDDPNAVLNDLAELGIIERMVEPIDDPSVLCDFYDWADVVGLDVDEWIPLEYTVWSVLCYSLCAMLVCSTLALL